MIPIKDLRAALNKFPDYCWVGAFEIGKDHLVGVYLCPGGAGTPGKCEPYGYISTLNGGVEIFDNTPN